MKHVGRYKFIKQDHTKQIFYMSFITRTFSELTRFYCQSEEAEVYSAVIAMLKKEIMTSEAHVPRMLKNKNSVLLNYT